MAQPWVQISKLRIQLYITEIKWIKEDLVEQ